MTGPEYWSKLFGPHYHSFDHKGVHFVVLNSVLTADEWTFKRWPTAKQRMLEMAGLNNPNGVACVQCHPNGANTHPETYPKFQQQLGRVITLREMINWCIRQPLEGKPLALDDLKMVALGAPQLLDQVLAVSRVHLTTVSPRRYFGHRVL